MRLWDVNIVLARRGEDMVFWSLNCPASLSLTTSRDVMTPCTSDAAYHTDMRISAEYWTVFVIGTIS